MENSTTKIIKNIERNKRLRKLETVRTIFYITAISIVLCAFFTIGIGYSLR